MTREEAKEKMLTAFLDLYCAGISHCKPLKDFVAGFSDEFDPFDGELYDMMRELVIEGKLVMFEFDIPEVDVPVEVLFPPGTEICR